MDKQLATMESVFQALADKTRLRILGLLLTGEVCVCHIHESLAVSQPKASRHLAYLRRAGIVQTRRQGLWVYYRLAESHDGLVGTIREVVTHTLGHLATVRRDAARLQKKTGCCLPASTPLAGLRCCGDAVEPASANSHPTQTR
jgi:ArsR family transcriptional regulator, arsenate/arsenite/antimonite-responsive transcriptional repressor